jgi:general secretion pathway protein C
MSIRWWTSGVWAAVAASALYWGFKLVIPAPAYPRQAQVADSGRRADEGDLSRLLGAQMPPTSAQVEAPAIEARFHLFGVISPRAAQAASDGFALIAIDGDPPKVFRVGAIVEGQNVLQAVDARGIKLGPRDGATLVALDLSPVPAATDAQRPAFKAAPSQTLASAEPDPHQTQQQRFHQRQQLQFEQEQMQNQGPYPVDPPPLPNGDPPADANFH